MQDNKIPLKQLDSVLKEQLIWINISPNKIKPSFQGVNRLLVLYLKIKMTETVRRNIIFQLSK